MLRNLTDLSDLERGEIDMLLDRSEELKNGAEARHLLAGVPVLNLFFEASTRTATSFTIAEQRVGADVVTFTPGASSLGKGETIADTALTLRAIGVRVIVVRHPESGFPMRLAEAFDGHVINAGDGTHAHPTQALLDLMTLRNEFGSVRRPAGGDRRRHPALARRALEHRRHDEARHRRGAGRAADAVARPVRAERRAHRTRSRRDLAAPRRRHDAAHPARAHHLELVAGARRLYVALSTELGTRPTLARRARSSCIPGLTTAASS